MMDYSFDSNINKKIYKVFNYLETNKSI